MMWRLTLVVLLIGLILAASSLLLPTVRVLLLMFAGFLFGIFLNSLTSILSERTPLAYRWSYAVVLGLLFLTASGVFYLMGWRVASKGAQLLKELDRTVTERVNAIERQEWAQDYFGEDGRLHDMVTAGAGYLPELLSMGRTMIWSVTGIAVILFVGLYSAFDATMYRTGAIELLPKEKRARGREVMENLRAALVRWLAGRIISMVIVGVVTSVGLWLLNVPLPVTLGVVAAILTFIPNIGPVLAAVPQVVLALNVSAATAVYVILFNLALQGVESYLISPLIQRHEANLPPVVAILVQLLMGILFGPIGLVTAAPLAVTVMVCVQMLYVHDRLDDSSAGSDGQGVTSRQTG